MKLLAVDDEALNLQILDEALSYEGFDVLSACHGKDALEKLNSHPDIDLILLDRMMPEMDGLTFLNIIRDDERFTDIPVIMQTALADKESMIEGIKAGVHHYLTKPYKREMLLAVVNAALRDVRKHAQYAAELKAQKEVLRYINAMDIICKNFEEAQKTAHFVAHCFPEPERVAVGLVELLINGIEHGNLNIGGANKAKLIEEGTLHKERERRLNLAENKDKKLLVRLTREADALSVIIKDQGIGFAWQPYLFDPHYGKDSPLGRGISIAKNISFDELRYNSAGNEVMCRVRLKKNDT